MFGLLTTWEGERFGLQARIPVFRPLSPPNRLEIARNCSKHATSGTHLPRTLHSQSWEPGASCSRGTQQSQPHAPPESGQISGFFSNLRRAGDRRATSGGRMYWPEIPSVTGVFWALTSHGNRVSGINPGKTVYRKIPRSELRLVPFQPRHHSRQNIGRTFSRLAHPGWAASGSLNHRSHSVKRSSGQPDP
jgi:hypothetical protein